MDARNEATNISTFEPASDLIQEDDCNTLLLYLPGFTKDQLRVQLTRTRVMKISGARPLGKNVSSFQKDFPVPENCDTSKITAKFEDGILYVRQPKTIQTQPPKIDPPTTDDHIKQAAPPINFPKQPLPTTQGGHNNKKPAKEEDKKKQPPEEDKTAEEEEPPEEDRTAKEEDKKNKTAKEEEPPEEDKTAKEEDKKKPPPEDKTARSGADKAAGSSVAAKVEADYSRLSPAARLKAVKDKMTNIVLLLFVFALGIYVTKLPWFSNRAHH